jgi:hypothetical protein
VPDEGTVIVIPVGHPEFDGVDERWHADPKPFVGHAAAADIIAKVRCGRAALTQLNLPTDH